MDGEGASKKRKFFHGDQEEEDDEQKIELFFALIRNIRNAREHLMNGSDDQLKAIENKRNKKKVEEEEKKIEVWKPSFQREDFMEEAAAAHLFIKSSHPVSTLVAMGSSLGTMKENTIKEGMDLSLSLSLGPKL